MKRFVAITLLPGLALAGCTGERPAATPPPPPPAAEPAAALPPADVAEDDRTVRATILAGQEPQPLAPERRATPPASRPGDVSLNFVGADVHAVARAVLGDILKLQYVVSPDASGTVTLATERPVARADVLPLLEEALRASNLAIVPQGRIYAIVPVSAAAAQAGPGSADTSGFATETISLRFISAAQFKRLVDPVLPNVVIQTADSGNSIVVAGTSGQRASVRDFVTKFDVNWLRGMSFALFVPQRTASAIIVPELDRVLNADNSPTKGLVRLIAMERINGILAVSQQQQYIEDVRRWIEILDREGENNQTRLFVYPVQNGRAADLAAVLVNAFGKGTDRDDEDSPEAKDDAATPPAPPARRNGTPPSTNGAASDSPRGKATSVRLASGGLDATITADETNNAIVVFTTPSDYAVIEDALRKLDILPNQVLIEAAIAEVTLNDTVRYGVQWLFEDLGRVTASLTQGATTPLRNFNGLSVLYAKPGSITATLNALENLTKIKVVSAPKLMVLNNQTASLQVGDQVPVATGSAVSVQNPDAPIVNAIEYKDTGIILKITPRVNNSGLVLLDVAQEVSDVTETTTSQIDSPTISTRRVATSVAVQDGQVIALGGLIRRQQTSGHDGLPFLGRIPILGGLFSDKTERDNRTELLILLRPRVVSSKADGDAVTDELRSKLQSLSKLLERGDVP